MQQKVESVLYTLLPHNAFPKPILQLVLKYMFYGEEAEVQLVHSRFGKKLKRDSTFTIGDKIEFTSPYLSKESLLVLIQERYLAIMYTRTHIVVYNYALQKLQFVAEGTRFWKIEYDPKEDLLVVQRQYSLETYLVTETDLERQVCLRLQYNRMVVLNGLVCCTLDRTATVYDTKDLSIQSQQTFTETIWDLFVTKDYMTVTFATEQELQYQAENEVKWVPTKEEEEERRETMVWI